jgi:hypothetical protein
LGPKSIKIVQDGLIALLRAVGFTTYSNFAIEYKYEANS